MTTFEERAALKAAQYAHQRVDLLLIAQMVTYGARVLDVGAAQASF